ncbi:transglutaminase TgpA family protein [Actinospongicola halichondriae]|uniref:transglutaminase TgpA family protein n=1 Tax=Actinospongicola halichondriae TaxID=3236844 RepID=UPI003D424114
MDRGDALEWSDLGDPTGERPATDGSPMTAATETWPRRRTASETGELPLLLLSEIALTAVTLAGVLGLRRAFLGTEWFPALAVQVVAAHGLAAFLRRRGVSIAGSVALVLAAGFIAVTWVHAGDTTAFGIPTGDTFEAIATALNDAGTMFSEVKAPTDALPGFLIASSAAVWLGVALSDWAAFRIGASLESTLPSATLFLLTAVLGADVDRVLVATVWVVTVLAFLLLRRADRLGHTATWVGDRKRTGPRSMLILGGALMAVAVLVAAVIGPRLPGAESEAILSLTEIGDDGPGTRVTVSPLVDIRSRLVEQADVEVFSVRSPVRSYWRLTSLDRFDGRIWSSNGSYGSADGDLDDGVPVASERVTFEQSFSINALAQIWLPAAYEPQSVATAVDLRYDEVSGTIIVDTDIPTSDNTDYRVTSALPQHDAAALATASSEIPRDIADRYLGLPDDFPVSVQSLAQEITGDATSTYDAALRLQDFFQDNFTYDLDVGAGHNEEAIEQFVLELRRGYCEQFAGSFAAMARSIGIPARVAVGFTPGNSNAVDPTLYRVRGEHAHAWPEVFLGEYGWVMFEPTPGRGAPFTEQYTGVPEAQVSSGGNGATATTAVSPPSTEPTTSPDTSQPGRDTVNPDDLESGGIDGAETEPAPNPWFGRVAWGAGILVAAVALYLLTVLVVTALRRQRRRRAAVEPGQQVALAWDDSLGAVRRAGVPIRDALTQTEVAERVAQRLPGAAEPMEILAMAVQATAYAPVAPSTDDGADARVHASEVERVAKASMSRTERLRTRFDPRRLRDG